MALTADQIAKLQPYAEDIRIASGTTNLAQTQFNYRLPSGEIIAAGINPGSAATTDLGASRVGGALQSFDRSTSLGASTAAGFSGLPSNQPSIAPISPFTAQGAQTLSGLTGTPLAPAGASAANNAALQQKQAQPGYSITQPTPLAPSPTNFKVDTTGAISSDALIGGVSVKDLFSTRAGYEKEILAAMKPSQKELDLTSQINLLDQQERELEAATRGQTIPSVAIMGQVGEQARKIAIARQGLAANLNFLVTQRAVNLEANKAALQFSEDNLSLIEGLQKLTQPQIIGSPQVNQATGDVTIFQKDPQTGAIVTKNIGNIGASKTYLQTFNWIDSNGNQVLSGITANGTIENNVLGKAGDKDNLSIKPPIQLTPEQQKDPFIKKLLDSAGGKPITDTFAQSLNKGLSVLGQLGVLQTNIKDVATGPIVGAFRGANPWDTNAQVIKAQLNAIVPNLARGVYGEVGVLTDNDVAQYSKTLPNLKSTEDIRNAVLGITIDLIGKSIKRTLEVNAANQKDVSGFVDLYTEMQNTRDSIFQNISGYKNSVTNTEFFSPNTGSFNLPGETPADVTTTEEADTSNFWDTLKKSIGVGLGGSTYFNFFK